MQQHLHKRKCIFTQNDDFIIEFETRVHYIICGEANVVTGLMRFSFTSFTLSLVCRLVGKFYGGTQMYWFSVFIRIIQQKPEVEPQNDPKQNGSKWGRHFMSPLALLLPCVHSVHKCCAGRQISFQHFHKGLFQKTLLFLNELKCVFPNLKTCKLLCRLLIQLRFSSSADIY